MGLVSWDDYQVFCFVFNLSRTQAILVETDIKGTREQRVDVKALPAPHTIIQGVDCKYPYRYLANYQTFHPTGTCVSY